MSARSTGQRLPLVALLAAVGLSACVAQMPKTAKPLTTVEPARKVQIVAMRQYRQCRDDAIALDGQARREASPARYLASARLLETCEAELGPAAAQVAREERMRAFGLGIQNYLRGGDLAKAEASLQRLKQQFPHADLYYPDGSSFIETMELLLNRDRREAVGEFALANVNGDLKTELRRVRYWTRN